MAYFNIPTILADINRTGDSKITDLITNQWGPEIDGDIDGEIKQFFTVPLSTVPAKITKASNSGVKAKFYEFEKMFEVAKYFEAQMDKELLQFIEGAVQSKTATTVPDICLKTAGNVDN